MFVDELELTVRGGRGGNGALSFRREKYVPRGGPDGGDGGNGGSVYLWADPARHSFLDLRYRRLFRAADGGGGRNKNQHGASGADLLVPVPMGTVVRDEKQKVIADLTYEGERALVAKGGRGGKGNARFATSRRRVPRIAEKGLPGEERKINLELKLMAQVGLVGLPNAGKSTLLGRISEAKPKTAAYPFTTLTPNLGVVRVGDEGSFIVADLPGLIEGAHEGAGLGHRFLRHVERNLLLLFLIDLDPGAETGPEEAYKQLCRELSLFSTRLDSYPRVIVGNKLDLNGSAERLAALQSAVSKSKGNETAVFGISAVSGEGVEKLIHFLFEKVIALTKGRVERVAGEVFSMDEEEPAPLTIKKAADNLYLVSGTAIERMAARTDFDNDEALSRFHSYCRRSGLDAKLRKLGLQEGDTVRIGSEEFTYYE